jgi:hypothetical protein
MQQARDAGELRAQLIAVPDAVVRPDAAVERAIEDSVRYLASDEALASLEADTYWPKWHSPWWHMLVLHDLGEARQIPASAVTRMIEGVEALPLHSFPIRPEDSPPGTDPRRHSSCHCALGSLYQVLAACGVDVDRALPWIAPWFVRYQMADGGLSCDGDAYLQPDECPSSMVGTIAPFEAMLLGEPAAWTAEHRAFVERAAGFLIERRLVLGSPTRHNAEERASAPAWRKPCWPRFYLYDIVRGIRALVRWAEVTGQAIPLRAVSEVVSELVTRFPDGVIVLERRSFEGVTTIERADTGEWRRAPASSFALKDLTSELGQPSAYSTRQWSETREGLLRLLAAGQVVTA